MSCTLFSFNAVVWLVFSAQKKTSTRLKEVIGICADINIRAR